MASNGKPTSAEPPLAFMQTITANASIYHPPSNPSAAGGSKASKASNDPSLILILGWFAAQDAHLAKYVAQHRSLFPSSRIVVLKSTLSHFLYPQSAKADFQTVLDLLLSDPDLNDADERRADTTTTRRQQQDGTLLIHVFSNGGVNTLSKIVGLCPPGRRIPRHVAIFDSCPAYFTWAGTHNAMRPSIPLWATPFVHLIIGIYYAVLWPLGYEPTPDRNARLVNESGMLAIQRRRLYLYGTEDDIVSYVDVEDHAAKAKEAGFEVTKEVFANSKHVAHIRVDPERYWSTVQAFWRGQA